MCFPVKWRRNTPYKGLLLDHPYTWRLEGTERSNVVQETEENVINYRGNAACWKNSLGLRKNKFPLTICICFFPEKSLKWMQRLLNIPSINLFFLEFVNFGKHFVPCPHLGLWQYQRVLQSASVGGSLSYQLARRTWIKA